jgi:AhpD family alkylhydroperoxidase
VFAGDLALGRGSAHVIVRLWDGASRLRAVWIAGVGTVFARLLFLKRLITGTGDPWRTSGRGMPCPTGVLMATYALIEYQDASAEVRAVYDDIMATRKTDWINNFWKAIAHDPKLLQRTWESLKEVMAPGAIDALTKELIYVAVSVTNSCHYCIASHTASAFGKGMTAEMFKELQAIIAMANATNKLVTGYQVEIDERFHPPLQK